MAKMVNRNYLMVTMLIGLVVGWMACSLLTMSGDEYKKLEQHYNDVYLKSLDAQIQAQQLYNQIDAKQAEDKKLLENVDRLLEENRQIEQRIKALHSQGY